MGLRALRDIVLVALLASPIPGSAQTCAGFADVPSASEFCASVAWIRNRGLTLGCAPGRYCPDGIVDRLQIAVFLSRMDNFLPPYLVDSAERLFGTLTSLSGGLHVVYRSPYGTYWVPVQPGSLPGTYRYVLDETPLYFPVPGCRGAAPLVFIEPPVVTATAQRSYVFGVPFGTPNARRLYATPPVPFEPHSALLGYSSRLVSGTCIDEPGARVLLPLWGVIDLPPTFSEPFLIR